MGELLPFQIPLAARVEASLRERRFHLLATCTGSGKSFIAAEVARRLQQPLLVICPKAAVTQTRRCAEAMGAGDLLLDVINPAKLVSARGCAWYTSKGLWKIPERTLVWFDEIHRGASGMDSKTTLAVAQLKAYGSSLLALSATAACDPLHLRALGYWSGLFRFSKPDYLRWCRERGCFKLSLDGRTAWKFVSNPERSAGIMRGIRNDFGDSLSSLGPEDIPGFPEEVLEFCLIDLDSGERREINDAYRAMSLRMKARGVNARAENTRERERIEFTLARALAGKASDSVEDGLSPVVFWNFTSARERFENELERLGHRDLCRIYGGQGDTERQRGVDAFNANSVHIASVMTEAGGAALSLHDALHQRQRTSYIVPSFNAASVLQALGRIRRCHGTAVVQRFVIAAGTVMERVLSSMQRKIGNIRALNDEDLTVLEESKDANGDAGEM